MPADRPERWRPPDLVVIPDGSEAACAARASAAPVRSSSASRTSCAGAAADACTLRPHAPAGRPGRKVVVLATAPARHPPGARRVVRAPLRFVYGNLCLGGSERDAWALFVAEPHPFDGLTAADKRERFSRLVSALEAVEADLQILRVERAVRVARLRAQLLRRARAAPRAAGGAASTAHSRAPRRPRRPREPWIAIAVRLAEPAAT